LFEAFSFPIIISRKRRRDQTIAYQFIKQGRNRELESCDKNLMKEIISVAPMMDWTDRHFRYMMRGITKCTALYTEMVVDTTIHHQASNLDFFIGKEIFENPSVIQVGGHDPDSVSSAAHICSQYGDYSEINLNCGCPSPRVSLRSFGAKLMLEPELVREIAAKTIRMVSQPVTIKCRIGVDKKDSYEDLCHFINTVSQSGVKKFIIHARKCILKGLTTKQNRDIPPLRYDIPHKLVQDYPDLTFILNGGLQTFDQIDTHLGYNIVDHNIYSPPASFPNSYLHPVHGCMIGRAAYNNPFLLATVDSTYYHQPDPCLTRRQVVERYLDYCDRIQSDEGPVRYVNGNEQKISTPFLLKPMHSVFNGCQGINRYRVAANDLYIERRRLHIGGQGTEPTPREVVSDSKRR